MRLRHPKDAKARIDFPKYGMFEFNPEGEVPDDAKPVIDFLVADGYKIVGEKAPEKKDEPSKAGIPPEPTKEAQVNLICPKCGKVNKTPQGLAGHQRFCKGK